MLRLLVAYRCGASDTSAKHQGHAAARLAFHIRYRDYPVLQLGNPWLPSCDVEVHINPELCRRLRLLSRAGNARVALQ